MVSDMARLARITANTLRGVTPVPPLGALRCRFRVVQLQQEVL